MRVALIFPGISLTGFRSYGTVPESTWIHHGICMLSACAKAAGHTVKLFDLRRLSGYRDLVAQVHAYDPDAIGITAMSVEFSIAVRAARALRRSVSAPIIIGGAHPTLMTDAVAAFDCLDYVLRGEGELAFVELLAALERGEQPPRVQTGEHPDLDELPFADRAAFGGPEAALPVPELPGPLVTLIAGRGCIYNCRFCQPAEREIFGRSVRRRSVGNVIAELETIRQAQRMGSVMLHDDCITENPAWVAAFCEQYRTAGFDAPFICQSRADLVVKHPDMIAAMAEAGLKMLIIGFESGNQRVLKFLRKGTTVEQNCEAATICRERNVKIWANYMLGIPTETREELMDTVRMIKTINPDVHSPSFYTPHPGTDLYTYCAENNLLPARQTWDRSPHGVKIRGVDYRFVRWARDEATGIHDLPARSRARIAVGRALERVPALKRGLRAVYGASGVIRGTDQR